MRRALPIAIIGSIIIAACSSGPRWEGRNPVISELPKSSNATFAKAGLIKIQEVDPTISIDLRYTRGSAIARRPLYQPNMPALLRPETAVRLRKANDYVKQFGYRIQVWDAYRPPAAQLILWEASGHDDRFVANPFSKPSQHSCGTAVDVTLVTKSGKAVAMPTGFDSFTPQAAAAYEHPDADILKRKHILQQAMNKAGFFPLPNEWWHFTDRRFRAYPDTVPLSSIKSAL
ncbi:M15 family metallopeptidase [Verrucomicrobiaceae bacterium 227]